MTDNKNRRMSQHERETIGRLESNGHNRPLGDAAARFLELSSSAKYSYNFSWLGRPVIQYPQDMIALQEVVWTTQPDLIIETGIAHGGSLIFSASLLALLDLCDGVRNEIHSATHLRKRHVLGVDVDIRDHNRTAIEAHPLRDRISMVEGSSTSEEVIETVKAFSTNYDRILVCLDSDHTHDHVLAELKAYAPLVTAGSYCVVFDTLIDDLPENSFPDREWDKGNNPKTAVVEFLSVHRDFEIDKDLDNKLMISVARCGYLRRIR